MNTSCPSCYMGKKPKESDLIDEYSDKHNLNFYEAMLRMGAYTNCKECNGTGNKSEINS